MPKIAVIDLGTNTFNLLIAVKSETNFQVVHSEKVGVALGMGGINQSYISQDAFHRGLDALIEFKNTCIAYGVNQIKAIGTSALRDAKNQKEFIDATFKATGILIEIISGEREAELIYKGVKWSYDFIKPALIMDIGGGSTEFILADETGILEMKSFNIGVSRIYQEFQASDPILEHEIEAMKLWLENNTDAFFKGKQCDILIGASGSFETFYEMIHLEKFNEGIEALLFPIEDLKSILKWVIASSQKERDEHPYIIPIRRKMAPIAAIKTQWVMDSLHIQETYVSPCALKEGLLYEAFIENQA